jgi:hypothetical protein
MSGPTDTPIGIIIDGLGCSASLEEHDLIADAVVIMKVIEPDGSVRLSIAWSDGMSWIERLGMLRAAEHIDLPRQAEAIDD